MDDYVIGICNSPAEVDAAAWDALLHSQAQPTPFMRHAYLHALHASGSANTGTGWNARFITLHQRNALVAAAVLYIKSHSMGEYVFDWAWANAYQQHGLRYYPKGLLAVAVHARACQQAAGARRPSPKRLAVHPAGTGAAVATVIAAPAVCRCCRYGCRPASRDVAAPYRAIPLEQQCPRLCRL